MPTDAVTQLPETQSYPVMLEVGIGGLHAAEQDSKLAYEPVFVPNGTW